MQINTGEKAIVASEYPYNMQLLSPLAEALLCSGPADRCRLLSWMTFLSFSTHHHENGPYRVAISSGVCGSDWEGQRPLTWCIWQVYIQLQTSVPMEDMKGTNKWPNLWESPPPSPPCPFPGLPASLHLPSIGLRKVQLLSFLTVWQTSVGKM